jgi:methionyl-tRNA synthetase
MKMKETVFVTAAIPYVNAVPHIGHAEEYVQADVLARYYRYRGANTRFLCGTDDNAFKNVQKAEESGEQVQEFVDRHAEAFETLLQKLNISNDDFIRTSKEERHIQGAQKLWQKCNPDDIYKKSYTGLYCVGCEEFKLEKDLVDGRCPEHPNAEPEKIEEENYFFKLTNYTEKLKALYTDEKLKLVPASRKNEVLAFLEQGLEDLSISRNKERMRGWGVPVPDDDTQVMYVWVDALSNYINALGYASNDSLYTEYWTEADKIVHVIGKGITRFHAIYWPAFLMSAGERLPDQIFSHSYLTIGGQKMSKSLGNVIDPNELLDEYGADAFRYFFLREVSPFEDSDVTRERFHESYNGNLANGIGNFTARVMKMATTHLPNPVALTNEDKTFEEPVAEAIEHFEFNKAMDLVFEHVGKGDRYIQENEPYKAIKNEETKEKALADIEKLVHHLYKVAVHLVPFMPETAEKIKHAVENHQMPETLFVRK